jgi:predicted amidohydrolase YtcJ
VGLQLTRLGRTGVIASMQPYHAIDDGRWAEKRIGPERIKTTYAFRSLLDQGAHLAFGSDWTVAPIDPLLGIYAAVTRRAQGPAVAPPKNLSTVLAVCLTGSPGHI